AGNSPGVNDGASAVVVTSADRAQALGIEPMARIVAQATSGVEPKLVMMAPVEAIRKLLKKTGWSLADVDLIELNEAFAVQAVAIMRQLDLDPEKVNVNGGAVALGHAIGQSGSRLLTTMLYEMKRRDAHRGIAALCLAILLAVVFAVGLVAVIVGYGLAKTKRWAKSLGMFVAFISLINIPIGTALGIYSFRFLRSEGGIKLYGGKASATGELELR